MSHKMKVLGFDESVTLSTQPTTGERQGGIFSGFDQLQKRQAVIDALLKRAHEH